MRIRRDKEHEKKSIEDENEKGELVYVKGVAIEGSVALEFDTVRELKRCLATSL